MKHPALARMLGVFLAVLSVVTIVAGGLGVREADGDYREQQRQDELLRSRIALAAELREQLEAKQAEYDAAAAVYDGRDAAHKHDYSAFRMDLATYTATRAGLKLGLSQLEETSALLEESMAAIVRAYHIFLESEAQFQKLFSVYQSVRDLIDRAYELYEAAAARAEQREEKEILFSPDEILLLAEMTDSARGELRGLLVELQEQTPDDQRQMEHFLRQAIEKYGEADLGEISAESLAYGVMRTIYDEARSAIDEGLGEGLSPEQAREAADLICEEALGLSFDELGQWIDTQKPPEGAGGAEIPPEMLDTVLGELPGDKALIGVAIGLLDESAAAFGEKEAAFRADPHDMSAAELLLAGCREGLDGLGRLIGLVEPTLLDLQGQLSAARGLLDMAWQQIHDAQLAVEEGFAKLARTVFDQLLKLRQLKRTRRLLEADRSELDALKGVIDGYESVQGRYLSVRAQLLADDEVYRRGKDGEDFLEAARGELTLREPAHLRENELRRVMCALMLAGGALGLLAALGAFEKPRLRRLWVPLLLASLLCASSEAISLQLGRGLLYSALFVVIFALPMIPLSRRKKGDQP